MTTETITTTSVSLDLAGVIKTEIFDVDMANQLLNGTSISKEEQMKLKAYVRRRENGRYVSVMYSLGAKVKSEMIGRLVVAKGSVGLQNMPRDIRSALTKQYYWDIDMKNAQPTLLLQFAKQRGWECSYLEQFVQKRDEILKQTQEELGCNRDEAKQRFIQLFFGSSYIDGLPSWISNNLYPELCKIKGNIYSSHLDLAKKLKKDSNSVMSYVLQTIERNCLLSIDRACAIRSRHMDVYIHDGGLIRKLEDEKEFPTQLLRELEFAVYKDTGYKVSLIQKPIETSFVREESSLNIYSENTVIDDLFASRIFLELNKNDIIYSQNNIYVFNQATGIWSDDEGELNRKIVECGESLIFRKQTAVGLAIYNYSGIVKNCENLKKMLPSILERNDTFLYEGRKKACFKLLFKNGIYDFKEHTFSNVFDRTLVFSHAVPHNYVDDIPQEDIDFVNNTFFVAPFSNDDTPRIFRHFLMRGLIGDYRMKKFLIALGDKNTSKGTMTTMCSYTFGDNSANFNANNLLLKKNQGDAEREFSWIGGIANSRLAFSNEIKNQEGIQIDGNMLKTMTGGGDEIVMRRLYKESEKVYNFAMPILFAQDLPSITPPDAINSRLILIQYDYSFMENPNPKRMEKQADIHIKDKLCSTKYANAFIQLMIQEYNNWEDIEFVELELPEFMIQDKEAFAPTTDIRTILEEEYELTGNEEDYIPYKELEEHLKKGGVTMGTTRLGKELTRLGLITKGKKVNRKNIQVRTGIKVASQEEE